MLGTVKTFNINSKDRTEGTPEDFIYELPESIISYNFDRVYLNGCSIPKSFYVFTSDHNTLTVDEDGIETVITIPEGNYSRQTIKSTLQSLFNTNLSYTYTVGLSISTGKISINVSNNGGVQPIISCNSPKISDILGFSYPSTNVFESNSFIGPKTVRLQLTNSILLFCDLVDNNRILQDIYSVDANFTTINFVQRHPLYNAKPIINKTENSLHIKLLDQENNKKVLNLNGQEISLTLSFFRSDPHNEIMIRDKILELQKTDI